MALRVCTCRRLFSVIWRTDSPCMRSSCESPTFSLEESEWCFESKVEPNDFWETDLWQIYLKNMSHLECLNGSQVTTYIEDREGKLERIDCAKLIFLESTSLCIASNYASQILDRMHELMADGVFTIVFIFDRPNATILKNKAPNRRKLNRSCSEASTCLESLSKDLGKLLYDDHHHPDIELRCGGHTFPAHRAIISSRSDVFEAMLQTDMLEKRTGSVEIVDMEPSTLREFLRYLYTGTLSELTVEMASRLYEASDKYSVNSLKEKCADFLSESLTEDNACELLALADAHSDPNMIECITCFAVDRDIPLKSCQWAEFSDSHPRRANDVLYRAYKAKCSPN